MLGGKSRILGAAVIGLALLCAGWSHAADPLGDQARQAKKPFVVDFGMTRCGQCIEQGKVMDRLKTTLGDRLLTRFVHIGKEEELADAYKVLLIPTIVIFDTRGKEVFRNVGLMSYDVLTGKLKELKLL
ncbi:MAG: thioredoxin family protein [Deltaproteobacteria bacterium]|nr:thioredoxin family protein [Deltaproteobacteria bacterium]